MKTRLIAVVMSAGAALGTAGLVHADNAVYSCTRADGTTTLTNVPVNNNQCVQLFSYTPTVDAPSAPSAAADAAQAPADVAAVVPQQESETAAVPERKPRPPANARNAAAYGANTPLAQRLSQRRDDVRQEVADAYARGDAAGITNPATNRRYLMTNRADYMAANGFKP
jgi:hypothetical protein